MFNSNSETSSNYKKIDITLGNSEEAAPFLGSNRQSYFSHNDFADSYPNTIPVINEATNGRASTIPTAVPVDPTTTSVPTVSRMHMYDDDSNRKTKLRELLESSMHFTFL